MLFSLWSQSLAAAFPALDLFQLDLLRDSPYLGLASPAYKHVLEKPCISLWEPYHSGNYSRGGYINLVMALAMASRKEVMSLPIENI